MTETSAASLPLADIRVLEFSQNIMGPSAGLILAAAGLSEGEIAALEEQGVVVAVPP